MHELTSLALKKLERIDDQIFKMATGSLVLSVTFRNSIVSDGGNMLWLLKMAWIAFLTVLLAHFWTAYSEVYTIQIARRNGVEKLPLEGENRIRVGTKVMQVAFVVGVLALGVLAICNN